MPKGIKHTEGKAKLILAIITLACLVAGMIMVWVSCTNPEIQRELNDLQYPRKYEEFVSASAKEYQVEEALIYAVIKTESGFDPDATSPVGAIGLMQLMPDTISWVLWREGNTELTTDDFYDPEINIHYGTYALSYLGEMYSDVKTLAAAYNAGPGNVDEWLQDPAYSEDGIHLKTCPYEETAAYAEKVQANYEVYQKLYYS